MADICMCTGDCPISEYCYRYMAEPNLYYQTYSTLEDVCIPNNYSEFIPYEKNIGKENIKKNRYTLEEYIFEQMKKQKD